ncbi:MAG: DUF177 domain-containing protein [Alphaproteobacteria bacterium]|nr:DUF177 domain-containing protein [Alphaproteobacteria bacterium]
MPKKALQTNEWSHFIEGEKIDKTPTRVKISADEAALKDVAVRAGVPMINALNADLTLEREQAGRVIHVAGRFKANLTLECVVSAEEFECELKEPVEGWFEDKESTVSFMRALKERDTKQGNGEKAGGVEVEVTSEEEDPEEMVNGKVDLGELVVQHLILAIPAYPHKRGVKFKFGDEEIKPTEDSPLRKNPFEALKDWKENR